MKWQGRRQSLNVIDMRFYPKTIILRWGTGQSSDGSLILHTSGNLYDSQAWLDPKQSDFDRTSISVAGQQNLRIEVYRRTDNLLRPATPTLTSGQKNTLNELAKQILKYVDVQSIRLESDNTEEGIQLLSTFQAMLNNN